MGVCLDGRGWLGAPGCACKLHGNMPPSASQNPVHSAVDKVLSKRFQALLLEKRLVTQTTHMQHHNAI